jgi:uncharacterized protein YdhG (YjbR/CyaY superfamily)
MQSKATDVPAYLKQQPQDRQPALEKLRKLCRRILKGYTEGMEFGMPSYADKGQVAVAFASQKHYISLYITRHAAVRAHRDRLKGLSVGKSCIRFSDPAKVDFDLVQSLLEATTKCGDEPCKD